MKRIIIEFLIGVPVIVLGYTLLDFLYCTFITHNQFSFDIRGCLIAVGVWAIVEAVTFLLRSRKQK